ncbi:MAG: hypothetical protein U9N42_03265 [Campylobacterota bacterium]|nr:hypothetical protein [Campylobacterota bacterium]
MFWEWSLLSIMTLLSLFLFVKMFYFSSVNLKEQKSNEMMKLTLNEAEIMIRKYQIQLQRSLGNIDIVTDELAKLRSEIKSLKTRNSKYRIDSERLQNKIKDLEARIDALL